MQNALTIALEEDITAEEYIDDAQQLELHSILEEAYAEAADEEGPSGKCYLMSAYFHIYWPFEIILLGVV